MSEGRSDCSALAAWIAAVACPECGHGILADHVEECNHVEGTTADILLRRNVCNCPLSDAEALALVLAPKIHRWECH